MKQMEAKGVEKSEAVLLGGKEWEKMDMQEKNIWRKKANEDWVEEDIDYKNCNACAEHFDQDFNVNNILTNEESSTKNNNLNSKNNQMGSRKRKTGDLNLDIGSNKKPKLEDTVSDDIPSTSKMTNRVTRAQSSHSSLQSLLDGVRPFVNEKMREQKTVHKQFSVGDLTDTSAGILLNHYKIENQDILQTAALAWSNLPLDSKAENANLGNNFGNVEHSLQSLGSFKQIFTEKKLNLSELFHGADELELAANGALQAMLLVEAMHLTGHKPSGLRMNVRLPKNKSSGLTRAEIKQRITSIVVLSEILFYKGKTFQDFDVARFQKLHKDLLKIATTF